MEFIYALIAGVVSGILSPLALSWLQHQVIWRRQKRLEMKWSVFQDAVRALSLWSRDALDPKLQANKASPHGAQRVTEFRPETGELIERSKGMVKAFFSKETWEAYEAVLRSDIALDKLPNTDFEKKRTAAIIEMARELGLDSDDDQTDHKWLTRLCSRLPT